MSPTSRNTLMIGGALILIALLLVCGPLSGRLGSGGSTVDEAPAVAAGPPADAGAALGAAASGAMAGATLGEVGAAGTAAMADDDPCDRERDGADASSGAGADGTDCPPVVGSGTTVSDAGVGPGTLVAGTALAAGATAAAVTAGGSGGGGGSGTADATTATPPPVSAGGPSTPVSAEDAVPGIPIVAAASGVYDDAVVSAQNQNDGIGLAGRIEDRFPPPVAAPLNPGMRVASTLNSRALILPCDSPGSGCRNVSVGRGPTPPGGGNSPIVPGGRPPNPTRNISPIVPGVRPTQIP